MNVPPTDCRRWCVVGARMWHRARGGRGCMQRWDGRCGGRRRKRALVGACSNFRLPHVAKAGLRHSLECVGARARIRGERTGRSRRGDGTPSVGGGRRARGGSRVVVDLRSRQGRWWWWWDTSRWHSRCDGTEASHQRHAKRHGRAIREAGQGCRQALDAAGSQHGMPALGVWVSVRVGGHSVWEGGVSWHVRSTRQTLT